MIDVVNVMIDIYSAVMIVVVSVYLVMSMFDSTSIGRRINRILDSKVDDYIHKKR